MKTLAHLIEKIDCIGMTGSSEVAVTSITSDSRQVQPGSLFVAVQGTAVDGHQFISKALDAGAVAVLLEDMQAAENVSVPVVQVPDSARALGLACSAFYDDPSMHLQVVGVTGTNGKTSVATLAYHLFSSLGYVCGLISTVENRIGAERLDATHTTPDAAQLQQLLHRMLQAGCAYVFMEVSSHAAHQQRIAGIRFAGAVFTNISHDHLDYHKTFEQYIYAKKMFFDMLPAGAFALVNADDKRHAVMVQNTAAKVFTFSLMTAAGFTCRVVDNSITGLVLRIQGNEVYTRLIGDFNAANLVAVYGVACLLGMNENEVLAALSNLNPVRGRMEVLYAEAQQRIGIVDYAHTPDAVEKLLDTLRSMMAGKRRLITVLGCGGDRDKQKRPLMAKAAALRSHQVILTSDNPRSEDPAAIIADMQAGLDPQQLQASLSITDRREAIKTAVRLAGTGDVVVVAGKGHENYQEIKGEKFPFDDKAILLEQFKNLTH